MARIVDDDPPIKTQPASKAYLENWERIFGEKDKQGCVECSYTGCVVDPTVNPATVQTEGDLLKDCPSCVGCGVVLMPPERPLTCEDCYRHDPACAKLCTEDADCDCGME